MSGEHKFMVIVSTVLALCLTTLYSFLFVALWPYRSWVGVSLLAVIAFVVVLGRIVDARGKLTEQALRQRRYRYREEIPLDYFGEPRYLPRGAQVNQHRLPQPPMSYSPYQESRYE